jgi:beta-lactamase class D
MHRPILLIVLVTSLLAALGCQSTPRPEHVDLSSEFGDIDSTFVVRDVATGETRVYRAERASLPLTPASTFKIPNSMIGLETGVLTDANTTFHWDPLRDPVADDMPQVWKGDHDLRSAFRNSVVWYYRELARRVGPERMQAWLNALDYGNRSIEGGIDLFWLRGDLRISAFQQVDFLERFVRGELPLKASTTATMREIMLIDETSEYRLYGKTGTAIPSETEQIGWLVGFVERGGQTSVFAFNMIHPRVWQDFNRERRIALVKKALVRLHLLPSPGL